MGKNIWKPINKGTLIIFEKKKNSTEICLIIILKVRVLSDILKITKNITVFVKNFRESQ